MADHVVDFERDSPIAPSRIRRQAPREPATEGMACSPTETTPTRRARSVRRSSHIDMVRLGSSSLDGLTLEGVARDVMTGTDGSGTVLAAASVRATLGPGRALETIETDPDEQAIGTLRGRAVATGFRAAVDEVVPQHRSEQTPLYLLLDELPVAALISGYADLYLRAPDEPEPEARQAARRVKTDICAGWASDATMMRSIANEGRIPIPVGPSAPRLESPEDPLGWHPIPPLAPGAMRRRRRIDVTYGDLLRIDAMFRDTHVGPDGTETVLHEYTLEASVEVGSLVVRDCTARARVLPWIECPHAVSSATRLAGRTVGELRGFVRQELVGTTTCTHLNDLLRSLADVAPLAQKLLEEATADRVRRSRLPGSL